MAAHYFLGARLLASGSVFFWEDTRLMENSTAFFCQDCGEIWARVMQDSSSRWFCANVPCERHGGGSFIFSWRRRFAELPPAVLSYELALLLRKHENATSI